MSSFVLCTEVQIFSHFHLSHKFFCVAIRAGGVACTGLCCCHPVTRFYAVSWRELAGVVSARVAGSEREWNKSAKNQIIKFENPAAAQHIAQMYLVDFYFC